MEFEEFFKKKKIDLPVLEKAEPALFSEFKTHYGQMGEKSFDHTKKYWFNKLRRQFPLSPEIKTEKVHIANPIAEQTVTESLIETVLPPPLPKVGFTPRFKAGVTKPTETQADKKEEALPASDSQASETTAPAPSPKVGFTPRFKAGVTKSAGTQEDKKEEALPSVEEPSKETPSEESAESKPAAYKPRFKMKPKTDEE